MDNHPIIQQACLRHFGEPPASVRRLYSLTNFVFKLDFAARPPVVFKVFNKAKPNLFLFRAAEMEALIDQTNFFGDLVLFQNDVYKIERFVINDPITLESLRSMSTRVLLMREITRFHKLLPPRPKKDALIFDTWRSVISEVKARISSNFAGHPLASKVADMVSQMDDFVVNTLEPSPLFGQVVLCHNDLLGGNLLFDTSKRRYMLIDFEYSGFGAPEADIYNLLIESTYDYRDDLPLGFQQDMGAFPDDESLRRIIRFYLFFRDHPDVLADLADTPESVDQFAATPAFQAISATQVEEVFDRVFLVGNVQNIYWSMWALFMFQREGVELDHVAFGVARFEDFLRCKAKFEQTMGGGVQ